MKFTLKLAALVIIITASLLIGLKIFTTVTTVANATMLPSQQLTGDVIRLKSREFTPPQGIDSTFPAAARNPRHGLVQFTRIPTLPERNTLRRLGVELLTYIPNRAFFARLPANVRPVLELAIVRYIGPLRPTDKVEARILQQGVNSYARNADGTIRLSVQFFEDVAIGDAVAIVTTRNGRIIETLANFHLIRADFPERALRELIAEDSVQWVEDVLENKITNDGARAAMRINLVHATPYGLDGTGAVIGEWDGGQAISTSNVVHHQDLTGRVTRGDTTTASYDAHATHVAGTAIGSGLLSSSKGGSAFQWKGMAPKATLIAYDWSSFLSEYSAAIGTYKIDLSTNSWMSGANGFYDGNSSALDKIITGSLVKRIPIFWAAGNQRGGTNTHACDIDLDGNKATKGDAYDCIANQASAKNTITIGATNSNDDSMTDFSSWGPTNDGRLKPDLAAPGCEAGGDNSLSSTIPTDSYTGSCGTSMATPAASGSAALLLQRFRQLCPLSGDPLPSTVKALLIHSARDLDDGTAWYNRGPDFASGYGRIDLPQAADLVPFHVKGSVSQAGVQTFPIVVASQQNLKVTLVWDDTAAAPNASVALVNDLDLELVDPSGGIHQPWVLNPAQPNLPATRGVDNRNVVEQVVVDNVGSALAGTWTIRVKGSNVPSLNQEFSLVSELLQSTHCAGPAPDADLWGKDTSLDTGIEASGSGPLWISDDIRVRLAPVDGTHENPELGQANFVYITVRNRGTQIGPYARVFLYWANASTGLGWPKDWNQLGTATAVNVPAGGSTVVGPIPWNPVGTGHYCLYARMITHNEPIATESADVYTNTNQSNQIIWKNVTVVDNLALADQTVFSFVVRNPRPSADTFNLAFEEPQEQLGAPFLERGQIFVDLGKTLYERWQRSGGRQRGFAPTHGTTLRVISPQRAEILGLSLRAREEFTVRIRFSAKELTRNAKYRFDVTQKFATRQISVGGVSYQLQAGKMPER